MMSAPTSNDPQTADLLALARLDDDGAPAPPAARRPVKRDKKRTPGGEAAQTMIGPPVPERARP